MEPTGEESIDRESFLEESKKKFHSNYEQWKEENPQYIEQAKEFSKNPQIPETSVFKKDPTEDIFLLTLYGMHLARRESPPAKNIEFPEVSYDSKIPQTVRAEYRTENGESSIAIGSSIYTEVIDKMLKSGNFTGYIDDEMSASIVSTGAHEYAHEVFYRKAKQSKYLRAVQEHKDKDNKSNKSKADYDSSIIELMAITWQKRVLQKNCPWMENEIKRLDKRINNAREVRKKE